MVGVTTLTKSSESLGEVCPQHGVSRTDKQPEARQDGKTRDSSVKCGRLFPPLSLLDLDRVFSGSALGKPAGSRCSMP
jgi:hypothetical protein